jgi:F-type H+-transporting ATPase subunit gamma
MANLRDLRLRMHAIEKTLQVTKAMHLISTAKLRKARRMLEDTEPYFGRIQKAMIDILSSVHNVDNIFFRKTDPAKQGRAVVLAITSDKGLAGGYNANIFRQVNDLCAREKNPLLILIGAVGYRYFEHTPNIILENFSFRSQLPQVNHAKEIADYIVSQYMWGAFNKVYVVYTHMYSSVKQQPAELQLLPLDIEEIKKDLVVSTGEKREKLHLECLPSEEELFEKLIPLYIKGVIYGSMVEAYASEQSARMAAMDEASKNAEDMLASMQIKCNRERQAGITQEISEIVGGSVALGN